jgi:hypothetical protein
MPEGFMKKPALSRFFLCNMVYLGKAQKHTGFPCTSINLRVDFCHTAKLVIQSTLAKISLPQIF